MASTSLPAAVRPANIKDASDASSTTRRAIFGTIGLGFAVATVTAAAPLAALTAPASAGVSPDLARLILEADRAGIAADRFEEDVWAQASAAWVQDCSRLPHFTVTGGQNMGGGRVVYSTDDRGMIGMARACAKGPRSEDYVQEARRFIAGHKRRERVVARLRRAHNLDGLREASDRLGYEVVDAIDAVVAFPCRSIADLNAKMVKVMEWQAMDNEGTPAIIAADVARLAREA